VSLLICGIQNVLETVYFLSCAALVPTGHVLVLQIWSKNMESIK
jgi:hypothetical protein